MTTADFEELLKVLDVTQVDGAGQFPMYSHPTEIAKHVLQAMALV